MKRDRVWIWIVLAVALSLLASCQRRFEVAPTGAFSVNTETPTLTPTLTPIPTSTFTPSSSPTEPPVPTDTPTLILTSTDTPSSTSTLTPTFSATDTPTRTWTPTPTLTNSLTSTGTFTGTHTPTHTDTLTGVLPTSTYTSSGTPTWTGTETSTWTETRTPTNTGTPTPTYTGTWYAPTRTLTFTKTATCSCDAVLLEPDPSSPPGPVTAVPGSDQVVYGFRMSGEFIGSCQCNMCVVSWVTLCAEGSGDDALDVEEVQVWKDGYPGGTLLGTGVYTTDNGCVSLAISDHPLYPTYYSVVYRFRPGTITGDFGIQSVHPTSLTCPIWTLTPTMTSSFGTNTMTPSGTWVSHTRTHTSTRSITPTPTSTPSMTETPTGTWYTATLTPTVTGTMTMTRTSTRTATFTRTDTLTVTNTRTRTLTCTFTFTRTGSPTPTRTGSPIPTPTGTWYTSTPTATRTPGMAGMICTVTPVGPLATPVVTYFTPVMPKYFTEAEPVGAGGPATGTNDVCSTAENLGTIVRGGSIVVYGNLASSGNNGTTYDVATIDQDYYNFTVGQMDYYRFTLDCFDDGTGLNDFDFYLYWDASCIQAPMTMSARGAPVKVYLSSTLGAGYTFTIRVIGWQGLPQSGYRLVIQGIDSDLFTPTPSGTRYTPTQINTPTRVLTFTPTLTPTTCSSGCITSVAGNGSPAYSGDGGPSATASLNFPYGIAMDGSGNLYIADSGNHRIRKVDTSGVITTVAGNGSYGSSGDGGPAISAQLWTPSGVEVDGLGNLYIADNDNHRIRKVDASGVITTVAGNGSIGDSGDGGPATSAQLNDPMCVVMDGLGNFFIAERASSRIRKVDTGGIITTVAGNGSAGYSGDGGPATSAQLQYPTGVEVDGLGNLYIGDVYNRRVRKVDPGGIITTIVGTGTAGYSGDGGPAISAQLYGASGVWLDGLGNLYIVDTVNHRIRMVDASGIITTVAGNGTGGYAGDGGAAIAARLNYPSFGVVKDGLGTLYIADSYNHRVRKVTP